MAFVYSRAQSVLVWLGGMARVIRWKESNGKWVYPDDETPQDIWDWLCCHEYWNRVWIVQEVGLAKETKFCYDLGIEYRVQSWTAFMDELNMYVRAQLKGKPHIEAV